MIQHYNFTATLTKIRFYKAKLAEITSLLLCKLLSIYSISAICICMYILMCFRSLATKNASFEMIREVTVFLRWHNTAMYCSPLLFILRNIFLVGFIIFFLSQIFNFSTRDFELTLMGFIPSPDAPIIDAKAVCCSFSSPKRMNPYPLLNPALSSTTREWKEKKSLKFFFVKVKMFF